MIYTYMQHLVNVRIITWSADKSMHEMIEKNRIREYKILIQHMIKRK
jgi:hypothetical protein